MSKDALFTLRDVNRRNAKVYAVCAFVVAIAFGLFYAIQIEAADYKTPNFVIKNASNYDSAKQFGETAEQLRNDMAVLWLGKVLPNWDEPCPVRVNVGNYRAEGETSMQFDKGKVFDWEMRVQGSAESILTAVLPHEITHMILASHFRQPSPRWFDEGAATLAENEKECQNYRRLLYQYLRTGRGIPFNRMFRMGEYPDDQMPLYAQGFSLAEFLIMQQGHQHYVDFASAGMNTNNWPQAMYDYYGYENLGELQVKWNRWVDAGCPDLNRLEQNQVIFVSETTQYIASKDFLPMREPRIAARVSQPASDVMLASWETPRQAQNTVSDMHTEREPIRLSLSQTTQNQPLVANFAPIAESGTVVAPLAVTSVYAPPVLSQSNSVSVPETRLPSYYSNNQPVSGQQIYQSSKGVPVPPPGNSDSRVIFESRIR